MPAPQQSSPRFRWWYLLIFLLPALPLLGYWWIDHKIASTIERANGPDQRLTVSTYSFGLFPTRFRAEDLSFSRDRDDFSGEGKLAVVSLTGIELLSLLNDGPVTVDSLTISGLQGELTRHSALPDTGATGDFPGVLIKFLRVDVPSFDGTDEVTGRQLSLKTLQLDGANAHFPFHIDTTISLRMILDSIAYQDTSGQKSASLLDFSIEGEIAAEKAGDSFRLGVEQLSTSSPLLRASTGGSEFKLIRMEGEARDLTYPLRTDTLGGFSIIVDSADFRIPEKQLTVKMANLEAEGKSALNNGWIRVGAIDGERPDTRVLAQNLSLDTVHYLSRSVKSFHLDSLLGDRSIPSQGRYQFEMPTLSANDLVWDESLSIGHLHTENSTLERDTRTGKAKFKAQGITADQWGLSLPIDLEELGSTVASVAAFEVAGDSDLRDYFFSDIHYKSEGGRLAISTIKRRNRLSPGRYLATRDEKSWLEFDFGNVRIQGIDRARLLSGEAIVLRRLNAGELTLKVVENTSKPPQKAQKPMPVEALRKLGMRISVPSVELASCDLSYGVIDTAFDTKFIHFREGSLRVDGLDTAPRQGDSVRLIFDVVFEDTSPLHAEFTLSRDRRGRNFSMSGSLGAYELVRVNPLMAVAANAIVESGRLNQATYQAELKDEVVTGQMEFLYDSLDLKIVGNGSWLKNLLSGLVVKKENEAGDRFRPGKIYHEHQANRSFFNAYWKGLLSGIKSSALSDIALEKELD